MGTIHSATGLISCPPPQPICADSVRSNMTGMPNTLPFQIQAQADWNHAYMVDLYVYHLMLEYWDKKGTRTECWRKRGLHADRIDAQLVATTTPRFRYVGYGERIQRYTGSSAGSARLGWGMYRRPLCYHLILEYRARIFRPFVSVRWRGRGKYLH